MSWNEILHGGVPPETPIVSKVRSIVAKYFNANRSHGYSHASRVVRLCERIWIEEGGDIELLRLSALLHDCESGCKSKIDPSNMHSLKSALIAQRILDKLGYPRSSQVYQIILSHGVTLKLRYILKWILLFPILRWKILERIDSSSSIFEISKYPPRSKEQKILWDADSIDLLNSSRLVFQEFSGWRLVDPLKIYSILVDFARHNLQTETGARIFLEEYSKMPWIRDL